MQKTLALFFALIYSAVATGTEVTRCGTDAFGNAVCLDKDGAVIPSPWKGGAGAGGDVASDGAEEESDGRAGNREQRTRCAVDPFGNRVCR